MTEEEPQKKLFFYHNNDNLCKDKEINHLQGFHPTKCPLAQNGPSAAVDWCGSRNRKKAPPESRRRLWVRCGARTHDTQNHNLVLYQLN